MDTLSGILRSGPFPAPFSFGIYSAKLCFPAVPCDSLRLPDYGLTREFAGVVGNLRESQ